MLFLIDENILQNFCQLIASSLEEFFSVRQKYERGSFKQFVAESEHTSTWQYMCVWNTRLNGKMAYLLYDKKNY